MRINRFEDIDAWQPTRDLPRKVYGLSKKTEFARDFGLRGQIQNAAGSLKGFKGSRFGASNSSQKKSNPER